MDKVKKQNYSTALFAYIISILMMNAAATVSVVFMPFFILAVSAILIYAVVQCGYQLGGVVSILAFITLCLVNYKTAGILASLILPVVFAAGYVIKKKKRLRDSVLITSGAVLAGVVLATGILQVITGMGLIDYIVERFTGYLNGVGEAGIKLFYTVYRYPDILAGITTKEAVDAVTVARAVKFFQDYIRDMLNMRLVAMMIIYSCSVGYISYIVPRAFAKKQGIDVVAIPAFRSYNWPRRLWLVYIVLYMMVGYGLIEIDTVLGVFSMTIVSVAGFVLLAQALSLLDHFYAKRNMQTGVRMVLHVLGVLILSGILIWVGLFENAMGIRKRLDMKGGPVR